MSKQAGWRDKAHKAKSRGVDGPDGVSEERDVLQQHQQRGEGIRSQKLRGNFPQKLSHLAPALPSLLFSSILIWHPGNFESSSSSCFSPSSFLGNSRLDVGWPHFNVIKEDYDPATLLLLVAFASQGIYQVHGVTSICLYPTRIAAYSSVY